MEITGKIRAIMPAQSGVSQRTGNGWMSQDYVLDYFWWANQQNASQMVFRVFGEERIKNFDLHVNDEVKIDFHVDAHEYDGRWFNEIQCTRCQKVGVSAQQAPQAPQTAQEAAQAATDAAAGQETTAQPNAPQEGKKGDDLPF